MPWAPQEHVKAARRALDELHAWTGADFPDDLNENAALALEALPRLQRFWVSAVYPAGKR